jgi:hypothetical protein
MIYAVSRVTSFVEVIADGTFAGKNGSVHPPIGPTVRCSPCKARAHDNRNNSRITRPAFLVSRRSDLIIID